MRFVSSGLPQLLLIKALYTTPNLSVSVLDIIYLAISLSNLGISLKPPSLHLLCVALWVPRNIFLRLHRD